jgi:hypothetical protein
MRQAEVKRLFKGAFQAARDMGLPVGSFEVRVENGSVRVLPIAANEPLDDAADSERRQRDAFGR